MKDAFYRWDGFRYYASFAEFLPGVALVTILCSIVAAVTALMIWLPLRAFESFCGRAGLRVKAEHLMLFAGILILMGALIWAGKRYLWTYAETTVLLKLAVFLCVTIIAIFLTWLFRGRAGRWVEIFQDRITPLVWLFGIWVILSVPLVMYHAWFKPSSNRVAFHKSDQNTAGEKNRPNIILVTFDALTARAMSVYGYKRETTPFISKWANKAYLFTGLEAESNCTTPTAASLMTGKMLWTHQTYHIEGSKPVKSDIESLPLLLKNNGYYNMAFIANYVTSIKKLGVSNGFEIAPLATEFSTPASLLGWRFGVVDVLLYRLFGDKIRLHRWIVKSDFIPARPLNAISRNISETTVPPEKAFNRFLEVIDNNPPEPFFAWIHLFPPHYPYLPPEPYRKMFDSSSELRTFKSQEREWRIKERTEQVTFDLMRARYDEFIRYCDKQFEDFITQLTKRNKLKDTVIILSSDHGESFEHNYREHAGPHLYEQVTHIPLIIKEPEAEGTEGRIIDRFVKQIDIPATILDLAGIPVPSWMEGQSLVPLMRGKKLPSKPIFSMNFEKNPSRWNQIANGTIAVWEGDYKLIHYLEEDRSLLFNLKEDPDELNNLFDKEPEIGRRLLALIKDNLRNANERIRKGGG